MMGFASDKTVADEKSIVPRSIALANIKLCGVLLSYADAKLGAAIKDAMGWNFPSNELGAEIMQRVVDLVREERVRAVVGRVADFDEVPAAFEAMANRETVGRTIVRLWEA
jgi:NADPH:quinone reductase-like Zn-dependent oxidoreductase